MIYKLVRCKKIVSSTDMHDAFRLKKHTANSPKIQSSWIEVVETNQPHQQQMKEKENIQKELASIAPLLAKQKGKPMPFKVPDLYFEELEQQVMEQVALPAMPIATSRSLGFWLTRVAALLLMALGTLWWFQPVTTSAHLLADISNTEIDQYITDHLYEFEEDLLLQGNLLPDNWQDRVFSEEEINLYLEEHVDDLEEEDLDYLL